MTKSTITREQLIKKAQEQIEFCRHTKITGEGLAHVNQCAVLFEIALAAMDSEPVYQERRYQFIGKKQLEYWADIDRGAFQYLPKSERRIIYIMSHEE